MKTNKLLIMLIIICFSFLSCALPWVYNYYSPEAEGGIAKKSMCNGKVGPKDMIEFSIDRVTISIKANEIQDGIKFVIDMRIPRGNFARISTSSVKVSIPSNGSSFEGFLKPQFYTREPSWKIGDLLKGETTSLSKTRVWHKSFRMYATINMPVSEMIKLSMPVFYINNKPMYLTDITFTKDKVTGAMPINC